MSDWMPCGYALGLMAASGVIGFLLGEWREQLLLVALFKPEI